MAVLLLSLNGRDKISFYSIPIPRTITISGIGELRYDLRIKRSPQKQIIIFFVNCSFYTLIWGVDGVMGFKIPSTCSIIWAYLMLLFPAFKLI